MNETETSCAAFLRGIGYKVLRNGWPDFLIVRDGRVAAVECKSYTGGLSAGQTALHRELRRVMPVHVVRVGRVWPEDGSRGLYHGDGGVLGSDGRWPAAELRRYFEGLDNERE